MSLPAAIECEDALIVFEGPRRIRRRSATGFELWPDAEEAEEIRDRIERGRPILVILGGPQAEATVLTEQFAGAPPALAELVHEIARDLAPNPVPALDWLPSQVARPRPAFPADQHVARRRTPALLRPALALEDRALTCPHVRFRAPVPTRRAQPARAARSSSPTRSRTSSHRERGEHEHRDRRGRKDGALRCAPAG